jgi:hypothetical protein
MRQVALTNHVWSFNDLSTQSVSRSTERLQRFCLCELACELNTLGNCRWNCCDETRKEEATGSITSETGPLHRCLSQQYGSLSINIFSCRRTISRKNTRTSNLLTKVSSSSIEMRSLESREVGGWQPTCMKDSYLYIDHFRKKQLYAVPPVISDNEEYLIASDTDSIDYFSRPYNTDSRFYDS